MNRVALLQTSDLHGKLPPPSAERLAALKASESVDFLVDSGDIVGAGNLGVRPHEPIWKTINALGYTAAAIGNREAHVWRSFFAQKVAPAAFPLLCANLEVRAGQNPTRSHLLCRAADGTRVAFFGLTVPMITRQMWSRHLSDLLFHPPPRHRRRVGSPASRRCRPRGIAQSPGIEGRPPAGRDGAGDRPDSRRPQPHRTP